MRTYFRAELYLQTEIEGDENSFEDQGCIQTFEASTLKELRAKLDASLRMDNWFEVESNRLESLTKGTEPGVWENWNMYISGVEVKEISIRGFETETGKLKGAI